MFWCDKTDLSNYVHFRLDLTVGMIPPRRVFTVLIVK